MPLFCIALLALVAFGVFVLVKPQLYYELTESWKHGGTAEPSELYLLCIRIGGVICILVGTCALLALLLA